MTPSRTAILTYARATSLGITFTATPAGLRWRGAALTPEREAKLRELHDELLALHLSTLRRCWRVAMHPRGGVAVADPVPVEIVEALNGGAV